MKELGKGGIQRYLMDQVELYGGMAEHFTSPGKSGVPDLIVTWPAGFMAYPLTHYIETKSDIGTLKPWQTRDHKTRRSFGLHVEVIRTKPQADSYVKHYGVAPART